jgi:hypothetical protein
MACEGDRLLARGDFTRVLRTSEIRQQLADARSNRDAQLRRQLVAAHERHRRTIVAPAQRVAEHRLR